jgi:hypothetical protein
VNAQLRLPSARADQIVAAVNRLEELAEIRSLTDLLKPGK